MPSYEIESNDGASWRRCLSVVRDRGLVLAARGIARALCLYQNGELDKDDAL